MTTRRALLAGGMAMLATSGCARQTKFRSYQGPQVTSLVAYKGRRRLDLMTGSTAMRPFEFDARVQPDRAQGAGGRRAHARGGCRIDRRNPNSAYHLSIGIPHPTPRTGPAPRPWA